MLNEDSRMDCSEPIAESLDAFGSLLYAKSGAEPADSAQDAIAIRLADTNGQRNSASMLLNRMYSWRGYGSDHTLADNPNSVTFTATSKNEVVGTLTLNVDCEEGLAAESTFADYVQRLRSNPDTRLCELTKFAFNRSGDSKPVLAAMFHIIFMYGTHRFDATDLLIEVNPRHVRFYEVMLGFQKVGELRTNAAVDAPSQLMWLEVAEIARRIRAKDRISKENRHSLYPYFFAEKEAEGLYNRMGDPMYSGLRKMPSARASLRGQAVQATIG